MADIDGFLKKRDKYLWYAKKYVTLRSILNNIILYNTIDCNERVFQGTQALCSAIQEISHNVAGVYLPVGNTERLLVHGDNTYPADTVQDNRYIGCRVHSLE